MKITKNINNPNILTLTPFYSPNIGGVETHLDDLTSFLGKNKYQQTIITYQPLTTVHTKAPIFEKNVGIKIVRLPWLKNNLFYTLESKALLQFLYLFLGIFTFSIIYILVNLRKVDIIHGHGLASGVAAILLAKIFHKKSAVSIHTIYKFNQRPILSKIIRKIFQNTDVIFVLSQKAKNDIITTGVNADKIKIYTNWIDLYTQFKPMDKKVCRQNVGLKENEFIVLFVGRLSPEKEINLLLQSINNITEKLRFLIIGTGPLQKIVELASKSNCNISFIGSVKNEMLPYYYNSADVLIFGSIDQDYFGRTSMGALACGLPIIIPSKTTYFNKQEKVTLNFPEGEIGFMVEPTSEDVTECLEMIYSSRNHLQMMKKKCREFAIKHFSEKNAVIFQETYRQLLIGK